jgi:zinc protease
MRAERFFGRRMAGVVWHVVCGLIAAGLLFSARLETGAQTVPPAPSAPRPVSIPRPVERRLRNGLRVIVIEDKNMPLVAAQMVINNGSEVDPPLLSGAADLTASLLTKGTQTRTAPEIARAIEALGGTLESGAGWDASKVALNVMSDKIDAAMAIMADVIRNPSFKEDEIARLRQQYLDNLSVALSQPGTLASFVASRVVFGDSPYGHPVSGTPESLARIKREDIVALHSKYYRPDNAILVFGGDIRPETAFRLAERYFGDWPRPATPIPQVAPEKNTQGGSRAEAHPRVVVIDMPGAGQAAVVLARAGIRRTDPDYFTGIVANSVLGGGYSSRLNQEIRIKRGLSYGASSALGARRDTGPFIASAQTKNQSAPEVASLLISELGQLASEPITAAELTPRKAALIGNFGRSLETNGGLVAQISQLATYGLSLDQLNRFIENVQAVTADAVQRFAATRISPQGANLIIAGDAKEFLAELRKKFPNVEVIPAARLDLNSAALQRAGEQAPSGPGL